MEQQANLLILPPHQRRVINYAPVSPACSRTRSSRRHAQLEVRVMSIIISFQQAMSSDLHLQSNAHNFTLRIQAPLI